MWRWLSRAKRVPSKGELCFKRFYVNNSRSFALNPFSWPKLPTVFSIVQWRTSKFVSDEPIILVVHVVHAKPALHSNLWGVRKQGQREIFFVTLILGDDVDNTIRLVMYYRKLSHSKSWNNVTMSRECNLKM